MRNRSEIRAIGAGINTTGFIPRFLQRLDIDFFLVAMPYTLLDQDALAELELCRERGVSVVIGAPFASGILAGGEGYNYGAAPPAVQERATRIREVCERHGVPLGAAALQFVLAHPVVASVIPGPSSPVEVRANVDWVQHPIPAGLWEALLAEGLIRAWSPVPT
jgi:D-threo-aldose 1-dehydrogenase